MASMETGMASTDSTCTSGDVQDPAPNEVRALSALAFDELRSFPGAIRDMHLGIARARLPRRGPGR